MSWRSPKSKFSRHDQLNPRLAPWAKRCRRYTARNCASSKELNARTAAITRSPRLIIHLQKRRRRLGVHRIGYAADRGARAVGQFESPARR